MSTPASPHPSEPTDGAGYHPDGPYRAGQPGAYGYEQVPRQGNPPGKVALAAGIAVVVLGLVQQGLSNLIPSLADSFDLASSTLYQLLYGPTNVVVTVLALVATVSGAIGVRRTGSPRMAAAAGLALGLASLASSVIALATYGLYFLF